MPRRNAVEMSLFVNDEWVRRQYPECERADALSFFGGLERLVKWLDETAAETARVRAVLQAEPLGQGLKDEILAAVHDGSPGPLDMARKLNIPLSVVYYVADGEPKIDTFRRPWLKENRYAFRR